MLGKTKLIFETMVIAGRELQIKKAGTNTLPVQLDGADLSLNVTIRRSCSRKGSSTECAS